MEELIRLLTGWGGRAKGTSEALYTEEELEESRKARERRIAKMRQTEEVKTKRRISMRPKPRSEWTQEDLEREMRERKAAKQPKKSWWRRVWPSIE